MYRCALAPLAAVCAIAPVSVHAQAVQRNFPENALRGTLVIQSPSQALLNGQPVQLAPGVRIRGMDNMLKLSAGLVGAKLLVHYTQDPAGAVNAVWILTPQEAARSPWPTTAAQARAWRFDPIAQAWSKP